MSGGGIGSALGAAAGIGLAPFTGGTSLLLAPAMGAAGGALGGGLGSALSGGKNPWSSALTGGLTGLLGGAALDATGAMSSGAGPLSSLFGDAAPAATTGTDAVATTAADTATQAGASLGDATANSTALSTQAANDAFVNGTSGGGANLASLVQPSASSTGADATTASAMNGVGNAFPSAPIPDSQLVPPPNGGSGLSNFISNHTPEFLGGNPSIPQASNQQFITLADGTKIPYGAATAAKSGLSDYLLPAGLGLAGISSLMPSSGSNPVDNSAYNAQLAAYNAPLPKYNYNSVSTPYTGNWYTYGQRPQTPMVQNSVTAAKRGGLIGHYAQGGRVHALAEGGLPMQSPMGAPAMPMPSPVPPQGAMLPRPAGMPPANPAQNAQAFQIGHKIGQALRSHIQGQGMTPDGKVIGTGKGQDDAVPAKLSQDEYIIPADVVSQLGDGSSNAGGQQLDKMVHKVRAHKVSHGASFPPKAKNPLAYIHGSA